MSCAHLKNPPQLGEEYIKTENSAILSRVAVISEPAPMRLMFRQIGQSGPFTETEKPGVSQRRALLNFSKAGL